MTVAERVGRSAVSALLREVAAAPKPGLVDRRSSGAHDDMDFMTFADSALALGPTFVALATAGVERGKAFPAWARTLAPDADEDIARRDSVEDPRFLAMLRDIGVEGEARMFAATGGVNTHKGALFIIGALAAAAGALIGAGMQPSADRTRRLAGRIVSGVSRRELPSAQTNGARAFRTYGSLGVRGEAESGLASLDHGALRILGRVRGTGRRPGDEECVDALLTIMTVADDTTVLHRGGSAALRRVHDAALVALALGGSRSPAGRAYIDRMSADFIDRRISPGGCADLLAAGLFLTEIEHEFADKTERRARIKTGAAPARRPPMISGDAGSWRLPDLAKSPASRHGGKPPRGVPSPTRPSGSRRRASCGL